jgi:hypothetical protein
MITGFISLFGQKDKFTSLYQKGNIGTHLKFLSIIWIFTFVFLLYFKVEILDMFWNPIKNLINVNGIQIHHSLSKSQVFWNEISIFINLTTVLLFPFILRSIMLIGLTLSGQKIYFRKVNSLTVFFCIAYILVGTGAWFGSRYLFNHFTVPNHFIENIEYRPDLKNLIIQYKCYAAIGAFLFSLPLLTFIIYKIGIISYLKWMFLGVIGILFFYFPFEIEFLIFCILALIEILGSFFLYSLIDYIVSKINNRKFTSYLKQNVR